MNVGRANITKGIEFTTVSYTAFSSLHVENQEPIATRLNNLNECFEEWLEAGDIKEIPLSDKAKTYAFDYRYLKVIFCFDSQNNVQVLDIINKAWLQQQKINKVA